MEEFPEARKLAYKIWVDFRAMWRPSQRSNDGVVCPNDLVSARLAFWPQEENF